MADWPFLKLDRLSGVGVALSWADRSIPWYITLLWKFLIVIFNVFLYFFFKKDTTTSAVIFRFCFRDFWWNSSHLHPRYHKQLKLQYLCASWLHLVLCHLLHQHLNLELLSVVILDPVLHTRASVAGCESHANSAEKFQPPFAAFLWEERNVKGASLQIMHLLLMDSTGTEQKRVRKARSSGFSWPHAACWALECQGESNPHSKGEEDWWRLEGREGRILVAG